VDEEEVAFADLAATSAKTTTETVATARSDLLPLFIPPFIPPATATPVAPKAY